MAEYYDFNANIPFTFKAIKISTAHSTYLRLFFKWFGDFGVYLGINRFDVLLKL